MFNSRCITLIALVIIKLMSVSKYSPYYYGGQSVGEGVAILAHNNVVIAVRQPSGKIITGVQPRSSIISKKLVNVPVIRGIAIITNTMTSGVKNALYAKWLAKEEKLVQNFSYISSGAIFKTIMISAVIFILLFLVLPLYLTALFGDRINSNVAFHIFEGIIRFAIVILCIKILGFNRNIKRFFSYHGAEHKVINALEAGNSMETANVKKYSIKHPRCSSGLIFVVMVIAIFVFALVGIHSLWIMLLARVILIPLIVGIGYEVILLFARYNNNKIIRFIQSPVQYFQSLVTGEPDDQQIEVAVTAMKKTLELDGFEEKI